MNIIIVHPMVVLIPLFEINISINIKLFYEYLKRFNFL